MERKSCTLVPQKKSFAHKSDTCTVPTVVCIGIVVDGVILLKAFVGYTNV